MLFGLLLNEKHLELEEAEKQLELKLRRPKSMLVNCFYDVGEPVAGGDSLKCH